MKQTLKSLLLRLPGGVNLLRRIRSRRFYRKLGVKAPKEVFTKIYEDNCWNSDESRSGDGSTKEYTENIRREIPQLIRNLGVKRVLDAPCGDYNWFRLIERENGFTYVGGDIVKPLILRNQTQYGSPDTAFVELDITKDPLPPGRAISFL